MLAQVQGEAELPNRAQTRQPPQTRQQTRAALGFAPLVSAPGCRLAGPGSPESVLPHHPLHCSPAAASAAGRRRLRRCRPSKAGRPQGLASAASAGPAAGRCPVHAWLSHSAQAQSCCRAGPWPPSCRRRHSPEPAGRCVMLHHTGSNPGFMHCNGIMSDGMA